MGRGTYAGLPAIPSDPRQQQVYAKWGVLILQSRLDGVDLEMDDRIRLPLPRRHFVICSRAGRTNLLYENLGQYVATSADDTQTTFARHDSGRLWPPTTFVPTKYNASVSTTSLGTICERPNWTRNAYLRAIWGSLVVWLQGTEITDVDRM